MDKNRHLISKYLEGELNPIEVKNFEEALTQDQELKEELDLYREVDKALSDTEVLDLRAQLDEIHDELSPQIEKRTRKSSKRVVRYAVAASIAVVLSIGTYGLFFKKVDSNRLVAQFYKPYDVTLVNRSANGDLSNNIRDALYLYGNQEYEKAVVLFREILNENPKMMASNLYSGISYMEMKEYKRAESSFLKVLEHNDNLYMERAEWYLGMVYIATDQKKEARMVFTKIKNGDGYFRKDAIKILRKINRVK